MMSLMSKKKVFYYSLVQLAKLRYRLPGRGCDIGQNRRPVSHNTLSLGHEPHLVYSLEGEKLTFNVMF